MKRFEWILVVALAALNLMAFSYGGAGSDSFTTGESVTASHMNEIDAGLDAVEAGTSIASSLTRDTEWDTAAEVETAMGSVNILLETEIDDKTEINAIVTGDDVVFTSDAGTVFNDYDADLTDLADGSLSGSKIGTGLDITTATAGTLATARMSSSATLDSEWDTAAKINSITTDQDFLTQTSTLSFLTTGSISGKVGLNSVGVGGSITATGMLGNLHYYTGAGAATFNLPTPVEAGLNACFYTSTTAVLTIDVGGGSETITLDGLTLSGGDSIDSPGEAGSLICLLGTSTTNWTTLGRSGTWIDGN